MSTRLASTTIALHPHRNGDRRDMRVELLFEPRDLWIGLYWTRSPYGDPEAFVCLLPLLPVRISILRSPSWVVGDESESARDTEIGG